MQIVRGVERLRTAVKDSRSAGATLALVPTMGALHAGHVALIKAAKGRADKVAASIFVNPLQFNDSTDLDRYPRQEESDLAMLEQAGCDLVWLPSAADLYPDGFATTVSVSGISERWEGEHRPGHFDGVATVVAKLLLAAAPEVALFGEKDFQQLAVIRRLVADLNIPVEILGVPTVRDADGLALSSRNAYLGADERRRALVLPEALQTAARSIRGGGSVAQSLAAARSALGDAGFARVDYLALVDAATLEPLDRPQGEMRLIAAATIGGTRLIDNLPV
ncbi:MAG TPA: pantoate--beta-alanine ligase [Sphingomicrobium sp.]|nr:pantoate--beta-alanine ligase [Sphingomicrobium sp.]